MSDWRDNKYGRDLEYSALNDAEDWGATLKALAFVLALLGSLALIVWGLLA